jgi:hypothetical protein
METVYRSGEEGCKSLVDYSAIPYFISLMSEMKIKLSFETLQ